jgi:hypothetical protein
MFIGAIPRQLAQQIVSHIDLSRWDGIYIGCSGSFRIEQAIRGKYPKVKIFSNDVSLLSCVIGGGATGNLPDVGFCGELEYFNSIIDRTSAADVMAAIGVALTLSKLQNNNDYCRAYIKANKEKARRFLETIKIDHFYPGDFRKQIDRAKRNNGGFMAFAPTYKGGYERIYAYLDANTQWTAPEYDIWNPDEFPALIQTCRDSCVPYCVYLDHEIDGERYSMTFKGSGRPVFCYTNRGDSSVRRVRKNTLPFKYIPINPGEIHAESSVSVFRVDSAHISFLKDVYLAKNIDFKTGAVNFLVAVDGMLAGGITISQSQFGDRTREAYILSDFSLTRERKVSKLVAMLTASREIIETLDKLWFCKIEKILTTAFTDKPVSMKYRGIFELVSRKPGRINYATSPTRDTAQDIFKTWYAKYAGKTKN